MAKKAKVRVGTASWTDPTLVKSGRFYPPGTSTAEARLRFYASQFPIVEVDPKHRDAQRVYADHLSSDAVDELWHRFHEALLPLDSAGKLGAVLMQYPEWFTPKHANREALRSLRERLPGYQVCIEFRNRTWLDEDGDRERTLDFLAAEGLPLVCLDMPQGFRSSMPPLAEVTAPELAVVRFHGRDREAWQHKGPTATPRFRYLYNQRELGEWVPKIEHLAEGARNVHVLLNNCYEDHAVVNARQLTDLLSAEAPSLVVRQD